MRSIRYTDIKLVNKMKQGKQHNNNDMRGDENTHSEGERVKIPLMPHRVRKRSRTMVTTRKK